MKEKLYPFSLVFLSLILVSSLLYCLHLRGKTEELEKQLSELTAYKPTPDLSKSSDLTGNNLPRQYRQAIEKFINDNLEDIVTEEHMTGGRWIVTKLKFLSPNQVQIDFEDGHSGGQIVLAIDELKITDVKYRASWR